MSMSIRPVRPLAAPVAPRGGAVAPVASDVGYVAPMPTVTTDLLGDGLRGAKDVVRAAMTGQGLEGATGLKGAALSLIRQGQGLLAAVAPGLSPVTIQPMREVSALTTAQPNLTPVEKAKKVARAAVFFALPVAGAAGVAAGLGWLIGPLVPVVGGHVFGAVAGALAVGQTTGFLLHGSMRLPLVTDPADRDYNSAGAAVGSAAIGMGLAALIGGAAGATVGLPLLAAGAAIGAAPRLVEWAIAKL